MTAWHEEHTARWRLAARAAALAAAPLVSGSTIDDAGPRDCVGEFDVAEGIELDVRLPHADVAQLASTDHAATSLQIIVISGPIACTCTADEPKGR